MPSVDYSALRKNQKATVETVSVNHRALITRTLTKYPVDYALYRELLQNSADAGAKSCVINFTSDGSNGMDTIHSVSSWPITKLTVQNNGALFEDQDWGRLKEIAKGNPNESKIGAFGVGFYSVFELTDEPLVHSGSNIMSFAYEGDQLIYKKQQVDTSGNWTIIDLPYRTPGVVPDLPKFTAFLTQSFMLLSLENVVVKVDDITLFELARTVTSTKLPMKIPNSIKRKSPNGTLSLDSCDIEAQKVTITYMNVTQNNPTKSALLNFSKRLFSSLVTSSSDPAGNTTATCFLRKVTAVLNVSVSRSFASQMKATVMKPPPPKAIISMLTFNSEEKELSKLTPPLINYMFPQDHRDAKIFIGFPTKQSSGMKSHLALNQVIPTMERTTIDMSNKFVKDWNESMLYMAGLVTRVVYEYEMDNLRERPVPQDDAARKALATAAGFVMSRFLTEQSAPDPFVGELIADGFWSCSSQLSVLSQHGIDSADKVKLAGKATFIKETAIVPKDLNADAQKFLDIASQIGYLRPISVQDVVKELNGRSLEPEEFVEFIKWGATLEHSQYQQCLNAAIVGNSSLGQIRYVQNPFTIEDGLPLPPNCLPYSLSKLLSSEDIARNGWSDLSIVPTWLEFIIQHPDDEDHNITLNPTFTIQILRKIERLNNDMRLTAFRLLRQVDCVPTINHGMKRPAETYTKKIDLFPDLPVVSPDVSVSQKFLSDLGVRVSVSMDYVMKLIAEPNNGLNWSSYDVIKYIQANKQHLKKADWATLRETPFLSSALHPSKKFRASEVFSPYPELKRLGYETISWKNWEEDSPESKILSQLGMRLYPSASDLFSKAHADTQLASYARDFYLYGHKRGWYTSENVKNLAYEIIPVVTANGKKALSTPQSCWLSNEVKLFGFSAVDSSFKADATKIGVAESPKLSLLIESIVRTPPSNLEVADRMFSFMAKFLSQITSADKQKALNSAILPLSNGQIVAPCKAYLATNTVSQMEPEAVQDLLLMRNLFGYVSVSENAQLFLQRIGMRSNPDIFERIEALVDNPEMIYKRSLEVDSTAYLRMLMRISRSYPLIKNDLRLMKKMASSKFLIAEKFNAKSDTRSDVLCSARGEGMVVIDDVMVFNLFKQSVLNCPPYDELERFYRKLGCPLISSAVIENSLKRGEIDDQGTQERLRTRIIERVKLFLETYSMELRSKKMNPDEIQVRLFQSLTRTTKLSLEGLPHLEVKKAVSAVCENHSIGPITLFMSLADFDWFDVAQCLVKVLLTKPTPDAAIVLETQLSSELNALERKGYNVTKLLKKQEEERIRRNEEHAQKEAEKRRVAEEHARYMEGLAKKQADQARQAESQRLSELERQRMEDLSTPVKANQENPTPVENISTDNNRGLDLASSKPESPLVQPPPQIPAPQEQLPPPKNNKLFKGWKSLFSGQSDTSSHREATQQGTTGLGQQSGSNDHTNPQPISNNSLKNVLEKGAQASKPFNGSSIRANIDQSEVEQSLLENSAKCIEIPTADLTLTGTLQSGTRCFVIRNQSLLNSNMMLEAQRFDEVLKLLMPVFNVTQKSYSIFFQTESKTVAFNSGGSLFFNLAYFLKPMHHGARPTTGAGVLQAWDLADALDYWYPVVAHELAHNIVQPHGADHSFVSESYVQFYLEKYRELVDSRKMR